MKKIIVTTTVKKLLADVYTPVGIYLRLRDRFRDTILLESTDNHAADNSWSFICINAIGGVEIINDNTLEYKIPAQPAARISFSHNKEVPALLWDYMKRFQVNEAE